MGEKEKTLLNEAVSKITKSGKEIVKNSYYSSYINWVNQFNEFKDTIVKFFTSIIAIIVGGILVVGFSISEPLIVQLFLVGGNIIALCWWGYKSRAPELKFKDNEESRINYCSILKIKSDDDDKNKSTEDYIKIAEDNNERVNKLVVQLNIWIFCYALSLIIVYGVFFIDNSRLWELLGWNVNLHASAHNYFKIIEDVFNFLSALFLYLGFKVLYNRTLNVDNTKKRYYLDGVIISALFIFIYLVFSLFVINSPQKSNLSEDTISEIRKTIENYQDKSNNLASNSIVKIKEISNSNNSISSNLMNEVRKITNDYEKQVNQEASASMKKTVNEYEKGTNNIVLNIFGLFIGLANGIAMALLFGRYISLEHLVKNRKDEDYSIFSLGTIFLLPVYALAQPLFGSFEINAFGDSRTFANIVFFICLLGKIFFLYFTYQLMIDKSLHYYLHLVITSHSIPKEFDTCFESNEIMQEANDSNQSKKTKD